MSRGLEDAKITPSKEYAIDIISAISNRRKTRLLVANIPNDDSLEGVPLGRFVELPVQVSGDNITSIRRFKLPKPLLSLINLHLDKFQLLVDGVLEREKDLVLQAMALDPLTPSQIRRRKYSTGSSNAPPCANTLGRPPITFNARI